MMATTGAKAKRRAEVQQRLGDSAATLADRLGIDLPGPARPVRDPELRAIIDLEQQADTLDAVIAALPDDKPAPKRTAKKASAS